MIKVLKFDREVANIFLKMPLSSVLIYKDIFINFQDKGQDYEEMYVKYAIHCNNYIIPCRAWVYKDIDKELADIFYTKYLLYDTKNKKIKVVRNDSFEEMCDYFKYQFITLEDFKIIGGNND